MAQITIEDSLHRELRIKALQDGVTLRTLVETALRPLVQASAAPTKPVKPIPPEHQKCTAQDCYGPEMRYPGRNPYCPAHVMPPLE